MKMRFHTTLCSLNPIQLPSPMGIHFWYVVPDEVKSEALLNKYMQVLSPIEKQNVLSLPSDHLQKRALLARTLVRTTLARYQINHHNDPSSLKFRRNTYGKPEVEWQMEDGWFPPSLHFNISHTSSLIACGVTQNSQIGIDVEEKLRKIKNNVLAFARRYFSVHEVEFLSAISEPEVQRQEFLKLWTLKEAYVKALGKGFSAAPFKTFTIRVKAAAKSDQAVFPDDLDCEVSEIMVESFDDPKKFSSNWQFALMELSGSHYASICVEKYKTSKVGPKVPLKLTVWKTIPFVEDECVSGTDSVVPIGGLVKII
ncbi:uncharacterized protein LOC126677197 [Mercurialis annua]|uniref:uncharacterized protein LOC126677197 n=1 Tax=Mercurialis annua TaxID=3986 RepID=UPI002160C971|nr:uncharacterized protein LOC126677197 [Mercurialis annua]